MRGSTKVLIAAGAVSVAMFAGYETAQAAAFTMPTELAAETVIGGVVDSIKGYITAGLIVTGGFFGLRALISSTKRKAAGVIRA